MRDVINAVELLMDPEAEAAVHGLWVRLQEEDLTSSMLDIGSRPHVSLAVYDDLDCEAARAPMEAFFTAEAPVTTAFASVGTFPGGEGVLFLAPVVTPDLLAVHARFHESFAAWDGIAWPVYGPGVWVPHCTLGLRLSAEVLERAVTITREYALPIAARFERAQLISISRDLSEGVRVLSDVPLDG